MRIACISLVLLGAMIMFYSIYKYYRSLEKMQMKMNSNKLFGNKIDIACITMMIFFFVGYLVVLSIFSYRTVLTSQDLLVGFIFFFGSIFVFTMINMVGQLFKTIFDNMRLQRERTIAEEGSKAKSEFLSHMSHELRTPMNAIVGMTRIGKETKDAERKEYCLEQIEIASKQLLGVINDVLDISKIEAKKFELSNSIFNVNKMLSTVRSIIAIQAMNKEQEFKFEIGDGVPEIIESDEQRLSQVLINLLGNAVKFTPNKGTVSLSVKNLGEKDGSYKLQFVVEDSGIGITKEQQERLFKSFEQAEGSTVRKYGGTGLGLAISKQIVEMMKGYIWIESEIGKGTRFIFNIQVEKVDPDRYDQTLIDDNGEESISEKVAKRHFEGVQILVAEDIEINREILSSFLEETGIVIDFAENGKIVYEMFKANPSVYTMIFMDVHMPQMNGIDATKLIRQWDNPYAKGIPIVAMTADVFREDIERTLASGMNDHLGKPLDIDEILEKIDKYMRK